MTGLVGVVAVALVAWFAAGTIWNVRLGRETMRWMQQGLPAVGGRTTVRWLGSSVVELVLKDAKPPFASVTLLIFLEPRDLPWWPLSRARGRRDTLIVRGVLKRAPAMEFEALDPASWSGREALARIPREWPGRKDLLHVRGEDGPALERAEALLARTGSAGLAVKRLSLRRAEPNFQLHVALPDRARPAGEFFDTVQALAEASIK
jgi:hypothetical protein